MVSIAQARKAALSLPEVEEHSHFNIPDFRLRKKIIATIHEEKQLMMIKLPGIEQSVFCAFDQLIVYPVPGGWGRSGATFFNLRKVKMSMLKDALLVSWKRVAGPVLTKKYFGDA